MATEWTSRAQERTNATNREENAKGGGRPRWQVDSVETSGYKSSHIHKIYNKVQKTVILRWHPDVTQVLLVSVHAHRTWHSGASRELLLPPWWLTKYWTRWALLAPRSIPQKRGLILRDGKLWGSYCCPSETRNKLKGPTGAEIKTDEFLAGCPLEVIALFFWYKRKAFDLHRNISGKNREKTCYMMDMVLIALWKFVWPEQ